MAEINLHCGIDEPAEEWVTNRLICWNEEASAQVRARRQQPNDPEAFHIFAREADGDLIGGVTGKVWVTWHWLQIDVMWVEPMHRKQGLGRRLLGAAEEEGRNRGCKHVRLNTGSYQAPGFYEGLGYRSYGVLEDFPPGETVYMMRKDL